jgi:hypothetical protein
VSYDEARTRLGERCGACTVFVGLFSAPATQALERMKVPLSILEVRRIERQSMAGCFGALRITACGVIKVVVECSAAEGMRPSRGPFARSTGSVEGTNIAKGQRRKSTRHARVSRASPQKNTRCQEQAKANVYISFRSVSVAGLHLLRFTSPQR